MQWMQFINGYARTFFDFWCLRPRRFFAAKGANPNSYLTPYEFLVASLFIGLAIYVAAFSLAQSELQAIPEQPPAPPAQALAIRLLANLVLTLLLEALLFRALSGIWPVRGNASFSAIFEVQCYMMAILLPFMALDLLFGPTLIGLLARKQIPQWSVLIYLTIGLVGRVFGLVFWDCPGVALVNGVSTRRLWLGIAFWYPIVVVAVTIVVVAFVIAALRLDLLPENWTPFVEQILG